MIWPANVVVWSGMAGMTMAILVLSMVNEEKNAIMSHFPLTVAHMVHLMTYSTTVCICVMKEAEVAGAISVIFPIAAVIVSFAVDFIYYVKESN